MSALLASAIRLRTKPSAPGFLGLAGIFAAVVVAPLYGGWAESARIPVLAGLAAGAMLASLLEVERASERDRAVMPPSFVLTFAALLLFGPNVALLVAAAGALTPAFATSRSLREVLVNLAVTVAATEAAALAHQHLLSFGMAPAWPWLALPLGAALVAYYLVQSALVELAVPLLTRQPLNRSWAKTAWRGWPLYVMGASVGHCGRGTRRSADVDRAAGRCRVAGIRLPHLRRLRRAARGTTPEPRGDRVHRAGHVRPRSRRLRHALERSGRAPRRLCARARDRPAARARSARRQPDGTAPRHQGNAWRRQGTLGRARQHPAAGRVAHPGGQGHRGRPGRRRCSGTTSPSGPTPSTSSNDRANGWRWRRKGPTTASGNGISRRRSSTCRAAGGR